jgi:hypothetical protein
MTPEEWGRLTPPQQSAFIAQHGPPPAHFTSPYQTAVAPPLPPAPAPRKSRKGLWIGLGVVGLLLVIGISNSGKNTAPSMSSSLPTVAVQPAASPAAPAAAPAAPSGPAAQVSDGNYEVGVDIAAGRYKTAGPGGNGALDICYWQRTKDDSGDFDSIISNDLFKGPGSVTVKKGEFVKLTGGCTWTKQ